MKENELVEHINPIRNMFLAQVIFNIFENGLYDALYNQNYESTLNLACKMEFSLYRLEGLLLYLRNEGIITFDENLPILTMAGRKIKEAKPWYQLLVGGYGNTLNSLSQLLQEPSEYGARNNEYIGVGSCGISQFDALPITKSLIGGISNTINCLVDIGCGDASYLIDLCKEYPSLSGIGVELDDVAAKLARQLVNKHMLSNRIKICSGGFDALDTTTYIKGTPVFIIAFVLQEILEQSGKESIIKKLQDIKTRFPDGKIVVIEVDRSDEDLDKMHSPLGMSYYNPYYLIHCLTQQRLEPTEFWKGLFGKSGWNVSSVEYPNKEYDSLDLKIGFLLE